MTVGNILHRFPNPFESAHRIVRQFTAKAEERTTAAVAWCEAASATLPFAPSTETGDTWSDVHTLVSEGAVKSGAYSMWVTSARRDDWTADGRPWPRYEENLLRALVHAWPQRRGDPSALAGALRDWVTVTRSRAIPGFCGHAGWEVAFALREYPDVAYSLIDADPCTQGCEHGEVASILLACQRLEDRADANLRDQREIDKISAELCLGNRPLFEVVLRGLHGQDIELAPATWQQVEQALEGPRSDLRWYRALWLLCADLHHQTATIEFMARTIDGAHNPGGAFAAIAEPPTVGPGLFYGAGWGRKGLGTKLLPVARVLVRHRTWPAGSWTRCFRLPRVDGREKVRPAEALERAQERVRDVLAEAPRRACGEQVRSATTRLRRGRRHWERGQPATRATSSFRRAVEVDRDDHEARHARIIGPFRVTTCW